MSLQASITGIQENIAELYLSLERHFTENHLIRDLWGTMAHDVTEQARSLKALPNSFWNHLKNETNGLSEAVVKSARHQVSEKKEDNSLRSCFQRALDIEEATILKLYIPILRNLRKSWTDHALDFYIMVKAHLARIVRVTESFSGDPVIVQRAHELLKNFEKEVQEPLVEEKRIREKNLVTRATTDKKHAEKPSKDVKPSRKLPKHNQSHHSRTKPLGEKIAIQRRRARSR